VQGERPIFDLSSPTNPKVSVEQVRNAVAAVDQNPPPPSADQKSAVPPVSEDFRSLSIRFLVAVLVAVRCRIVCLCVRQYAAGLSSHHIHYDGLIRQNAAACDALQKRKKLTQNPQKATS
jgi:hypothetical protein